jgi:thioredoxin 1
MAENIFEVTDENFEKEILQGDSPALVDFWAPWCGPCKAIGPVIKELADSFGDKMKFAKFNVDENPDIPAKYGIQAIPTVIFFNKGKEADKFVGMIPKAKIEEKIKNLI